MKDFLSAKGLQFTEKNIATDILAREELVNKYGRLATPALVIGDTMFLGFKDNREKIEKLLDTLYGGTNA